MRHRSVNLKLVLASVVVAGSLVSIFENCSNGGGSATPSSQNGITEVGSSPTSSPAVSKSFWSTWSNTNQSVFPQTLNLENGQFGAQETFSIIVNGVAPSPITCTCAFNASGDESAGTYSFNSCVGPAATPYMTSAGTMYQPPPPCGFYFWAGAYSSDGTTLSMCNSQGTACEDFK